MSSSPSPSQLPRETGSRPTHNISDVLCRLRPALTPPVAGERCPVCAESAREVAAVASIRELGS